MIAQTLPYEDIFEEDATFHVGDQYFPIEIVSERIFNKVLHNYKRDSKWIEVEMLLMGIDHYTFDDSYYQLDQSSQKSVSFLNM